MPLHASLFLFNDLEFLCIPCKSLKFLALLFSISTDLQLTTFYSDDVN